MIAGPPRALIVDDDPVSLAFLGAVLDGVGCRTRAFASPDAALADVHAAGFDVLLIDRRLPGSDGPTLLRRLRSRRVEAPAIAMSAAMDATIEQQMHEAGFAATLAKPATIDAVRAVVGRFVALPSEPGVGLPTGSLPEDDSILDDRAAAAAIGGDTTALAALRRMLVTEITSIEHELREGAIGNEATAERLHRLRASCGFCGAPALAASARRLDRTSGDPLSADDARVDFLRTCRATLAALAAADASLTTP